MLRVMEIKNMKATIKNYPHQLLYWQKDKKDVLKAATQFTQYNCEEAMVIVKSPKGWSIFTVGDF